MYSQDSTPFGFTSLSSQIRTVSGTSVGGSEVSFLDQGYEDIELNKINPLTTTRLVASPANETARLTDLPKNRSTTLSMRFQTFDENLSPVVDTMNGTIIFGRNRLNKPVTDYVNDERVKLNVGDPHSGIYISNRVDLKQPATSIKVLISSDRKILLISEHCLSYSDLIRKVLNNHLNCSRIR